MTTLLYFDFFVQESRLYYQFIKLIISKYLNLISLLKIKFLKDSSKFENC